MASTGWQRSRELFHACVDLDSEKRRELLDRDCADAAIRAEVESLLASAALSGTFLETPAGETVARNEDPSWIDRTLGAYRITALLATGGMGEVYRAVRADGLYANEVAIKLIRRELASQALLDRFRAEREILAALQHPNIARILDAGVTEGKLPYIVMELVEGEPIDRYCRHHALPVRARLKLFLEVCAAVQCAHQHLTVHRDLKPGNILVTHEGVVKLVDFGIAKVLESTDTGVAPTALHAMTPEFSSPEQIRGGAITTATDIYSLGVVLYRLLTANSPYRATGLDPYALAREVCETEPTRPSGNVASEGAAQGLVGLDHELDSIVLMAMRKERDQRYQSVQQFAADVQSYLDHRPIAARGRSILYTLRCFVTRNRSLSIASALLAVVLITGVAAVVWQARIAAQERDRAQRHFDSVRQLANGFMFDMHDEIAKIPGSVRARQLLVNKALTYLDMLSRESGTDAKLKMELAEAYLRVGSVQGEVGFNNLGDHEAALKSFRQAAALIEGVASAEPMDAKTQLQLVRAYNLISSNLRVLGRLQEQQAVVTREVEVMERLSQREPDSTEVQARLGHVYYQRSQFRDTQADKDGAMTDALRAVQVYERLVALHPEYLHKNNLAFAFAHLGEEQLQSTDPAVQNQGIESLRKTFTLMSELINAPQSDVNTQRHFAVSAGELGAALVTLNRGKEGLPFVEQAEPVFQKLFDADRNNRLARLDVITSEINLSSLWVALGEPLKAIEHGRRAVATVGALPAPAQSDLELSAAYVEAEADLSEAYAAAAESGHLPTTDRRDQWRLASASAAAALKTANAVISANPEVAGDYTEFIARARKVASRAESH